MRIGRLLVSLILCHILMSCADQHLAMDQLIVGGVKLKDADEVSSHLVNITLTDSYGSPQVCTGVFVSRDIILTAKHCVGKDFRELSVTYRPADYEATGNVENLTIINTIAVAMPTSVRNDLILLHFSERLPRTAKIAKISSLDQVPTTGEFIVAGYGMHAKKVDVLNQKLIYGDKPRSKTILVRHTRNYKNHIIINQQKAGGGVCSGDSGGPAFFLNPTTKQMNLIGIASAVSSEEAASNCLDRSYIIKTDFLKTKFQKKE